MNQAQTIRIPKFMRNEPAMVQEKPFEHNQSWQQKAITPVRQNLALFIGIFLFLWTATSVITVITYEPSYSSQGMVIIKDTALTAKYITNDNYETTTSLSTSPVINTMGLLKADVYKRRLWEFFQQQHPEELTALKIKNYPQWDAFFGDGSDYIAYSNAPGTDLINLEFKWRDPKIAKEGLEVLIDCFRGLSLELNQSEQRERGKFLANQINDIQSKLTLVRYKISQVKEQNQIIDLVEENSNLARVRLNLKTDMNTVNAEARGKSQQLAGYQQLLGMTPNQAVVATAIGRNEVLGKLQSELYTLRAERNSLLTRYTDHSVKVQDVNNRIKQLEANIEKELKRTVGNSPAKNKTSLAVADTTRGDAISRMINAKTDAMELGAKGRVLGDYLNELDKRAQKLNQVSVVLANFKLEESSLDESLKTLKEKELDAKLKESQMLSNVFVVEPPQLPLKEDFPQQKHLLIIDFLLALGIAFAAIYLKYLLFKPQDQHTETQAIDIQHPMSSQSQEAHYLEHPNQYMATHYPEEEYEDDDEPTWEETDPQTQYSTLQPNGQANHTAAQQPPNYQPNIQQNRQSFQPNIPAIQKVMQQAILAQTQKQTDRHQEAKPAADATPAIIEPQVRFDEVGQPQNSKPLKSEKLPPKLAEPQFVEISFPANRQKHNNLPAYQNSSPFHTGAFVYPNALEMEGSRN